MATEYIVIKERGVKGVDAPFYREQVFTIPANWDSTFTVSGSIQNDVDGNPQIYILYNGLRYGHEFFTISNNVATWTHPYLELSEGDSISLWYVK